MALSAVLWQVGKLGSAFFLGGVQQYGIWGLSDKPYLTLQLEYHCSSFQGCPTSYHKQGTKFIPRSLSGGVQRYGIWGAWDEPYLTLQPEYEAAQVGVFGAMFLQGHIYRGRKPVHWSPSSRTALAEAELEVSS